MCGFKVAVIIAIILMRTTFQYSCWEVSLKENKKEFFWNKGNQEAAQAADLLCYFTLLSLQDLPSSAGKMTQAISGCRSRCSLGTSCANLLIAKILHWGIAANEEIEELDWNVYLRRTPHSSTGEFKKEQPLWEGRMQFHYFSISSIKQKTIRGTKKKKNTDNNWLQLPG